MPESSPTTAPPRPSRFMRRFAFFLAFVAALTVTAVVGVAGYLWIVSGLPMSIVWTVVTEAVLVGLALGWILRRARVRGLGAILVIAFLCGTIGAAYWNYSFYVRETLRFAADTRHDWALILPPDSKEYTQAIQPLNEHPFEAFDRAAIYPRTKHHGYFGYVIARGPASWTLSGVQIAIIMFLAAQVGWVSLRPKAIA